MDHSDNKIRNLTPLHQEGNVLFNDALNTFYLRLYGVRHMGKASHEGVSETRITIHKNALIKYIGDGNICHFKKYIIISHLTFFLIITTKITMASTIFLIDVYYSSVGIIVYAKHTHKFNH